MITSDIEQAWTDYRNDVEISRQMVLSHEWSRNPIVRAQGMYLIQMLQTFGFHLYLAPRTAFPKFYSQTIFLPFETAFGAPSPDFSYYWTFLDGARTYRIWGESGTTRWTEFQLLRGFWGDRDMQTLGTYDFDHCEKRPDGSFEIIASPTEHPGNWLKLDPEVRNVTVLTREAWYDWERERGMKIHIEALDLKDHEPIAHSGAEMNRRIRAIGHLTRFDVEFFIKLTNRVLETVGKNTFYAPPMHDADDVGGNPRACYVQMVYDIKPDEALLIETHIPIARYWSLQLADMWWQTTDYAHHHSSINGHQAHIDADGKCRMVISFQDPGVPNWVDPVDASLGIAQWRWYLADRHPIPSVRKVPVNAVRSLLPPDTPQVTPQQRRQTIAARARAVNARFGF
ncbi:MAG: hypothetical protein ACLP2F_03405 [Steroidobacteraceae bacterium]